MSTISEIAQTVKIATDYQKNKKVLLERISTDLHFTHNGGLFKATPETIAFVATWQDETLFLTDTYDNPIKITKNDFLQTARQHYQAVMNEWHIQHEELKRIRRI